MRSASSKPSELRYILLALFTMLAWGSLYPVIKVCYRLSGIEGDNIAAMLMLAAWRFLVCGTVVTVIAVLTRAKLSPPRARTLSLIGAIGIFSVLLHYGFSFVGLSMTDSSKTAILKQVAPLLFACISFLFVKGRAFSPGKPIGALVGFCGILAISLDTSFGGFNVGAGDLLILAASLCSVISMIISERVAKTASPLWITGISQLLGGAALFIVACSLGGSIPRLAPSFFLAFAYMCVASILGYVTFYSLQRKMALSKLFIIKFSEPLFACVVSAILLRENILQWRYLIGFLLISTGIVLASDKKAKQNARLSPSDREDDGAPRVKKTEEIS